MQEWFDRLGVTLEAEYKGIILRLWKAEVGFVLPFSPSEDWTVNNDGNKENNNEHLLGAHCALQSIVLSACLALSR